MNEERSPFCPMVDSCFPRPITRCRCWCSLARSLGHPLESCVVDSACFLSDKTWLEKDFGAAETFAANSNYVPIWELISFFLVGTFCGRFHFSVKVQCNVA